MSSDRRRTAAAQAGTPAHLMSEWDKMMRGEDVGLAFSVPPKGPDGEFHEFLRAIDDRFGPEWSSEAGDAKIPAHLRCYKVAGVKIRLDRGVVAAPADHHKPMVDRWIEKYTAWYPIRIGDAGVPVAAPTNEEIVSKLEVAAVDASLPKTLEIMRAMKDSFGVHWRDVDDAAKMHGYKILLRGVAAA